MTFKYSYCSSSDTHCGPKVRNANCLFLFVRDFIYVFEKSLFVF